MARYPLIPLLAAALVASATVPAALADGDPASDYLITQSAFLPFNAPVDNATSAEFLALLAASKKAGFEIRVAVIAARSDLGSIPVLFHMPGEYARFLGQELFYWYKGELLVVMPNGYGVYHHGPAPAADRAVVAALAPPGSVNGNSLVEAADRAVQALASRRGIDLSHVAATGSKSSTGTDRIEIAAGVAVALALFGAVVIVRRRAGR